MTTNRHHYNYLIRMTAPADSTRKRIALARRRVTGSCDVISGLSRLGARGRVGSGTFAVDREAQEAPAVRPSPELVEIVAKHRRRKSLLFDTFSRLGSEKNVYTASNMSSI